MENRLLKLILLLIISIQFLLANDNKLKVAVLDLKTAGVKKHYSIVLSDKLRSEFFKIKKFEVMNREDMQSIMEEQSFQLSGTCDSKDEAVKLGHILGVKKVITGSVGLIGNTYSITLKQIDIETARNDKIVSKEYRGKKDDLFELLKETAKELYSIIGVNEKIETLEKELQNKNVRKNNIGIELSNEILFKTDNQTLITQLEKSKKKLLFKKNRYENNLLHLNSIYTPKGIILRSSILPGWGQFKSDRNIAGSVYSTLVIAGVASYVYFYSDYKSKKDEYSDLYNEFQSSSGFDKYIISNKLNSISDDKNKLRKTGNILLGAVAMVYIANIVDAALFTSEDPKLKNIKMNSILNLDNDGEIKVGLSFNW